MGPDTTGAVCNEVGCLHEDERESDLASGCCKSERSQRLLVPKGLICRNRGLLQDSGSRNDSFHCKYNVGKSGRRLAACHRRHWRCVRSRAVILRSSTSAVTMFTTASLAKNNARSNSPFTLRLPRRACRERLQSSCMRRNTHLAHLFEAKRVHILWQGLLDTVSNPAKNAFPILEVVLHFAEEGIRRQGMEQPEE